jgi:NitT/TauT family transport system substrate-binding protein
MMTSATLTTAAAMNGETDLLSGLGSAVRAAMQGLPMKAVAAGEHGTAYTLVGRPGLRGVADLRGGKVGTAAIGTGDYHVLVDLMRRHGLDPQNDVTILAVGGTLPRFTALSQGSIDAGLLAPPASIHAERQGLVALAEPKDLLPYPSAGLTTTEQMLANERAFVKSALRGYVRGLQRIRTDRPATVATIRELLDMDEETAQGTYEFALATLSPDGTAPEEALRVVLEIERTNLGITQEMPLTTGMDFTLVEEIRRELGLVGGAR